MWAKPRRSQIGKIVCIAGSAVLLLGVVGGAVRVWPGIRNERLYWFSWYSPALLILRYVGAPPSRVLDYLPIIGRQSPSSDRGDGVLLRFRGGAGTAGLKSWNYRRAAWG